MISILVSAVGLHDLDSPDRIYTDVARERYFFWHGLYWQCIIVNLIALAAFLVFFSVTNAVGIFAALVWWLLTSFGNMSVYSAISDRGF